MLRDPSFAAENPGAAIELPAALVQAPRSAGAAGRRPKAPSHALVKVQGPRCFPSHGSKSGAKMALPSVKDEQGGTQLWLGLSPAVDGYDIHFAPF